MKAIRYIIFIPIMFLIIGTLYTLLPIAFFEILRLSKIWLIILLIFFGGLVVTLFKFLPYGITRLSSKISPSKNFAYYSTISISIIFSIIQINGFWRIHILSEISFGYLIATILTCLTIGLTAAISLGKGIPMKMSKNKKTIRLFTLLIGTFVFYTGITLTFCLLSTKICFIDINKSYAWYSGVWQGLFVIPHWIVSWFSYDINCKAQNFTAAYNIWWWISFIYSGLQILYLSASSKGEN